MRWMPPFEGQRTLTSAAMAREGAATLYRRDGRLRHEPLLEANR